MEKKKLIRKFDDTYLFELIDKDNALLCNIPEKLHGGVKIDFECNCSIVVSKLFRDIAYYGGAYCKDCCKKNKRNKIKETCIKKYGVSNPSCIQEIKDKKEKTYIEHYGMHPRKTEEVKEKYRQTCLKRYNTDNTAKTLEVKNKIKLAFNEKYGGHPMHNQIVKDKVKETCIERYGGHQMHNQIVKDKVKETCIEKYGGYPAESEEVRDKMKATTLKRFGCEYAVQNKDIMEKVIHKSKSFKKYTMPSGDIRNIQGYEPFAITILLKDYTEEQIKTHRKDVPRIAYIYNDLQKYYFPDIYLPHINCIIEVKSSWTYKKDEDKNKIKKEATEKEGYTYEFWIFDRKGNRL
jgi:hypothetical protein